MGYCVAFPKFNCWRCGKKRIQETIQALTGQSPAQVRDICQQLPRSKEPASVLRAGGVLKLPAGIGPLQACHRRYIKGRKHSVSDLETLWGVQGIGLEGLQYKWRLFLPFVYRDKTVSWTTRSIGNVDESQRYRTAQRDQEVYFHKHLLYGLDYVRHTTIVVEGIFDVWRIGPGATALLGTRWSNEQLMQLARIPVRYICLDQGAERYSQKLVNELCALPGKTHQIFLDSKDPDSATKSELQLLRNLLR